MAQGFYRRKSRPQAQQQVTVAQERWDGALDVDSPADKIAANEVAEMVNLVGYRDYIQGATGKRLYSKTPFPGSGTPWDWQQHPVTKRVLLHRGNQFWLSSDAAMTSWTEVTAIGPDGSLTATAAVFNGLMTVSAPLTPYLSQMRLAGVELGETVYVRAQTGSGQFAVMVYSDAGMTVQIALGTIPASTPTPATITLSGVGGSGVSGTVSLLSDPGGAGVDGTATGTGTTSVTWTLSHLTAENTDDYTVYWRLARAGGNVTITMYKDAALTEAVASGVWPYGSPDAAHVAPLNGSGITGYSAAVLGALPAGANFVGAPLLFEYVQSSIDASPKINFFRDYGFLVFLRGDNPKNIFVDQRVERFWELSTTSGYADGFGAGGGAGNYRYRYLATYCRIVDANGQPDYSANRTTGALDFEGPSNAARLLNSPDYAEEIVANPISVSNPNVVALLGAGGGESLGSNAAAYITHIGIYRTLEIIENPSGQEVYIWVADVPVYSTSYSDSLDDAALLNRGVAGYGLKTRFWTGMAKGVGAIGPDFLFTAAPDTAKVTYTDVSANPRFIGYHNPALQFMNVRSPVLQIIRARDLFVILSKTYTMYSVSGINENGGNPLAGELTLVIKHLEPSSESIGINGPMSFTFLNETDFAAHCGDGTVRVFSGDKWGRALDGENVHTIVGAAREDAALGFIRDALYLFYVDAAGVRRCIRFGFGSYAGFNWSRIARETWAIPPLGLRPMRLIDEAGVDRLIVSDEDDLNSYSIEDENDERQWVDDVGDSTIIIGDAASRFSNFQISGYLGSYLYGYYQAGFAYTWILFSDEAMTDEVGRFALDAVAGTYNLTPGYAHPGASGSVDFDGDIDFPDSALDVSISVATAIEGDVSSRFTDLLITGYSSTLYGYYQTGLAYTWVLFSDEAMTDEVGRFDLTASPGTVTLTPAAGYPGVAATVYFDGNIDGPDSSLNILFPGYTSAYYPTLLRLRELTGARENFTCYHNQSHIYIEAIAGYALPDGLSLSARALSDGAYVPGAVVDGIPYNGDIEFRAQVRGRRIQVEYESNMAGFRISGCDTAYETRDMASATGPSDTPEYAYQRDLATGLQQWLTRPYTALNSANGLPYDASGAPARVTDPTGAEYALKFTDGVSYAQGDQADLSGDYTIMGWWEPEYAAPTLAYIAGAAVEASANALVTPAGTVYDSVFTGGWKHVAIIRRSGVVSAYKNGVLLGTADDATVYSAGSVSIGNYAFKVFDLRVYGKEISAAALAYYVDDIATNRGRKVLSVF